MRHSNLLPDLRCGWPTEGLLLAVVAEGRRQGGFQVLVAAETLEGDSLGGALLLVLDVVCDYEDDFFDFVLNELEGPFDLFLICLFGQAFTDDLHPFPKTLFLTGEGFGC